MLTGMLKFIRNSLRSSAVLDVAPHLEMNELMMSRKRASVGAAFPSISSLADNNFSLAGPPSRRSALVNFD